MKTVLFDVDGVLADFVFAFTKLAGAIDGTGRGWGQQDHPPGNWKFDDHFEKKVINAAWDVINHSSYFWASLPSLVSETVWEQIEELHEGNHVVFATARATSNAKHRTSPQRQTQEWLAAHGVHGANVVLTEKKGDFARAINADYAIDDKPENVACIHWISDVKPTKAYFKLWPSTVDKAIHLPENIKRVASVAEFLNDIMEGN